MNPKVSAYAPGKMFLLGEYAVVNDHHPAIIVALNQGVHVYVEASSHYQIHSSMIKNQGIFLEKINNQLHSEDDRYTLVIAAINTMMRLNPSLPPFSLIIKSELDHPNAKKYGFGSSGAVIVAIIKALSMYSHRQDSILDIFKLSIKTQHTLSPYSSYGDIAVSCFGGLLYYQKGNTDFLVNASIKEVLNHPLDGFIFESLPFLHIHYCIGYTHQHAFSSEMVRQVQHQTHPQALQDFLAAAKQVVDLSKVAIINNEIDVFLANVDVYRQLLVTLQSQSHVPIETSLISMMIQQANTHGALAKTSGAGGGDCVLAFASDKQNIVKIKQAWKRLGVEIVEHIQWEEKNES